MHKGEMVKILDCNNGQLVIHYNLALANSLCVLSDKITQIGEDVCKYIQKEEKRGRTVDLSKYWERLGTEFDKTFGKGSCRIVFGSNMVSIEMMDEFWKKTAPYFEQLSKEILNDE